MSESQTYDKRSFVLTATFSEQEAQQRHWGGTRGWDFPSALSAAASWLSRIIIKVKLLICH